MEYQNEAYRKLSVVVYWFCTKLIALFSGFDDRGIKSTLT